MGLLWRNGVPRTAKYRLLEKYDKALELNGKPLLDKKTDVIKDIELLVQLRNALMHYEPENVVTYSSDGLNPDQLHKFEQKFKGKFKLNPLTGEGNAFYPEKLLGYGCGIWGLETAARFVDHFSVQLGIPIATDTVRQLISEIAKPDR
jgi:hypothetical protein